VKVVLATSASSVQHARLVGRYHVFDVDESVLAAVLLEGVERLERQVAQIALLALRVLDAVPKVLVLRP